MASIILINPTNDLHLTLDGDGLVDSMGNFFPIINGVPRIADLNNYSDNFGVQWNKFDKTQLDRQMEGLSLSRNRFFAEMGCNQDDLSGKNILEVGSGAGRFSKVVLDHTQANLYSVDYSDAVSANYKNNGKIAPERFHLFQASIYEMPFPSNSFDKVFCFGVLQHTPSFEASIKALINKAKVGSEIVVDFYPINGWWTKLHSKYLLRPFTKKINHQKLFNIIEGNIDWMIRLFDFLNNIGLGFLTRFIPITDIRGFPKQLSDDERREWAILDTFDAFSPEYDNPQRIKDVVKMFENNGAKVTYSGFVKMNQGTATVVRAIKK
jgi:ubiquinone/menaquinone biosynthesis C-methylase UbiE